MNNLNYFLYPIKKINELFKIIIKSKFKRRTVLVFLDLNIILWAFIFSFLIRYEFNFIYYIKEAIWLLKTQFIISIPVYLFTGQYSSLSTFFELKIIFKIIQRNILINLLTLLIGNIFSFNSPTVSVWILMISISSILNLFTRALIKKLYNYYIFSKFKTESRINVAIYGASYSGANLSSLLRLNPKYQIKYFLDDNKNLWGRNISGIAIKSSNPSGIYKEIDQVLVCIESINKRKRIEIVTKFKKFGIPVLVIPSIDDIFNGKTKFDELNAININDLLGRKKIDQENKDLSKLIKGKNIFVSGAGGSIGAELCEQILSYEPSMLILFEISEISLYTINSKLTSLNNLDIELIPILGSATDQKLIEKIFKEKNVNMVFHASAYKHVPLVEVNPLQGLINNVLSTKVLCEVSSNSSVEKFCLISTDKAVRPTNIMGASKRLAELIVQSYSYKQLERSKVKSNLYERTKFFMVRFGNVLNSSGSVVPLFQKQILQGGPVTITHKKVTRYFMTISEAVLLVLNAACFANGAEVFLLDMGSPVLIKDLATQMIKLSGLSVKDIANQDGDIEIVYTGLRPGEKLFEELLIDAEALKTEHKKIFKATEKSSFKNISEQKIEELIYFSQEYNLDRSLKLLKELVPEWNGT